MLVNRILLGEFKFFFFMIFHFFFMKTNPISPLSDIIFNPFYVFQFDDELRSSRLRFCLIDLNKLFALQ